MGISKELHEFIILCLHGANWECLRGVCLHGANWECLRGVCLHGANWECLRGVCLQIERIWLLLLVISSADTEWWYSASLISSVNLLWIMYFPIISNNVFQPIESM